MRKALVLSLVAVSVAVGFGACDTGSSPGSRAGVSVYLTDAPIDLTGVHAVNVTIHDVVLYPTDSGTGDAGGISIGTGPIALPGDLTLNLLDFQGGKVTFLGSQGVPAASYTRIRLEVTSAELVRDDDGDPLTPDIVEPVTVPSGKVDVPVPFELTADETMQITLDFDAASSVQVNSTNGKNTYLLRPVVTPVGMQSSKP